jgi:I/LWEQ domain
MARPRDLRRSSVGGPPQITPSRPWTASARLDPVGFLWFLSAALASTNAIAHDQGHVRVAARDHRARQGLKGSSSTLQFFRRNTVTGRLISAARSVAFVTNLLIETGDGALSGTHSYEQLIMSNEVALIGATAQAAQLVAVGVVCDVPRPISCPRPKNERV